MAGTRGHAVWKGRFIEVHVAPFGTDGRWEYVKRARGIKAAVILATTEANEIVLVEQHRVPLGRRSLELPAGLAGDETEGESPFDSAQRELLEETGFEARTWESLGEFASSPGMVGETYELFRATGLTRTGPGGGTGSEGIEVHVVAISALPTFIAQARTRGAAIDTRLLIGLNLLGTPPA